MLAALGLPGCRGVHEEERARHLWTGPTIARESPENVVDEERSRDSIITRIGAVVALGAPQEKSNLSTDLALFFAVFNGNIRARLVIHPLAVPVIKPSA